MSAKISYQELRKEEFIAGLTKIYRYDGYKDIALMLRIIKAVKLINKELESAQEIYLKLLKQYAKLDAQGNFVPPPGKEVGHGLYCIEESKSEEWIKKQKEFYETEVELHFDVFAFDAFKDSGLSPAELEALGVICVPA